MSSFESRFSSWLRSKMSALDDACGRAMHDGTRGLSAAEFDAANRSVSDMYATQTDGTYFRGWDCDYSLKGVGALYTGHWHGKRVHNSLSIIVPIRADLGVRPLEVIDIGAGTGATLWAWTLLACFAAEGSAPVPVHSWTSLDASPEMVAQSDRLWLHLCRALPQAKQVVDRREPIVGNWRNPPVLPPRGMIVASYLFSRSDLTDPAASARNFAWFVREVSPSVIAVWTTASKSNLLTSLSKHLRGSPLSTAANFAYFVRKISAKAGSLWTAGCKLRVAEFMSSFARWKVLSAPPAFSSPLRGQLRSCVAIALQECERLGLPEDERWRARFNWGGNPLDASFLCMSR